MTQPLQNPIVFPERQWYPVRLGNREPPKTNQGPPPITRPGFPAWTATRFPHTGAVAEVKPHTASGIAAGLRQLRGRPRGAARHLLTYRQVAGDTTRYDILISEPESLAAALRPGGSIQDLRFYPLGKAASFPNAEQDMKVRQCTSLLGEKLEAAARNRYLAWTTVNARQAGLVGPRKIIRDVRGRKHPNAPGVDVSHEAAEFFHELASELARAAY